MSQQYFGTDGVRGEVGKGNITPENIMHLGWAAGMALKKQGSGSVLIGKDTRLSGYLMEGALQAGFCAAGVDVKLLGPMPTPGISYLTQTFRADAGVVISASHNPYFDNGVKIFGPDGKKISSEIEADIELNMQKPIVTVAPDKIGKAYRVDGAAERYIEFCKSRFPARFSLLGKKIVLDCAHGATYHIANKVFTELGADVVLIGAEPNGLNINEKVGATSTKLMMETVLEHNADVGVAYDGDGDRLIMVDHLGNIVDGDQLVFILARDALKNGRLQGGVVGTLMTNFAMEKALSELGVPFVRANVGDKHVLAELNKRDWHIGGEGSGHILNLLNSPTGDAIIASLQVLTAMQRLNMSLNKLASGFTPYPQIMKSLRSEKRLQVIDHPLMVEAIASAEKEVDGRGRLLIRLSGTEPVMRIMVEHAELLVAQDVCEQLVSTANTLIRDL
jgi:phosphoglucosamine mutase